MNESDVYRFLEASSLEVASSSFVVSSASSFAVRRASSVAFAAAATSACRTACCTCSARAGPSASSRRACSTSSSFSSSFDLSASSSARSASCSRDSDRFVVSARRAWEIREIAGDWGGRSHLLARLGSLRRLGLQRGDARVALLDLLPPRGDGLLQLGDERLVLALLLLLRLLVLLDLRPKLLDLLRERRLRRLRRRHLPLEILHHPHVLVELRVRVHLILLERLHGRRQLSHVVLTLLQLHTQGGVVISGTQWYSVVISGTQW